MKIEDIQAQQDRAASVWRNPHENETKFYVDVPFQRTIVGDGAAVLMSGKAALNEEKLAEAKSGDIITRGYGSTWIEDRDGEFVHPSAFDKHLGTFLEDNPMMLWQHNMDWPLGKFLDAATDPYGLDMVGMIPKVKDAEPDWRHLSFNAIERGIVRTKSIGGYMSRMFDPDMEKLWITEVELMEVSIVTIPANPTSIFEAAVKAVGEGGSRRPTLTQTHIDQMMQVLGAAPMTDPQLRVLNEKGLREKHAELAAFYGKCGKRAPQYEEWNELAKDVHGSTGLAGVRGGATRTIAFIRKVQGHATPEIVDLDEKRGRTISKKNENKLTEAKSLLDEVLESVKAENDEGLEEIDDGQSS